MTTGSRTPFEAALSIIRKLRAKGHVVLLAGGCVRDRILGRTPKDYDLATDATPARVQEIFPRSRQVGAKFGVTLVRRYGHDIEVATFRADGSYADGRHPDRITFGTDIEDARRRDFTINGLFFDPIEERVIDYVDGQADLTAGIIRTIGDPERRFAEDHLRMLRAVRFAARLGFTIEAKTRAAIQRLAPNLQRISAERIWMELEMILTDPSRTLGWLLLVETGLQAHVVPSWPARRWKDEKVRARLAALRAQPIDPNLALAVVLGHHEADEVARICRALRLSNRASEQVVWMIRSLPLLHEERSLELADLKSLMVEQGWSSLLELMRVDLVADRKPLEPYERLCYRAAELTEDRLAPPPLLTGNDLCYIGLTPGMRMGEILRAVYRAQLNEQITTHEDAVGLARKMLEP